jgi:Flp pilus assembly pilin Flp
MSDKPAPERPLGSIIRLARDCRGATAVEYSLIAGIIALALLTAAVKVRDPLVTAFVWIGTQFPASSN